MIKITDIHQKIITFVKLALLVLGFYLAGDNKKNLFSVTWPERACAMCFI